MPEHAVRDLIGNSMPRVYGKGELLFSQGEPADAFFVILSGWVKVFRLSQEGEETILHVFSRGETFAEAATFMGGRYPANAEVVTPSRLLRVKSANFRTRLLESPELALAMLASVSHQLKVLVEQLEQIKTMSAPRRVADFLMSLCPNRSGVCTVILPYEKSLIARRLGMKPESFSRAVAKLKPLGVRVNGDSVTIGNREALAAYAITGVSPIRSLCEN